MLTLMRAGMGVKCRSGRIFIDMDVAFWVTAGTEGVVHLIPVIDINAVIHHHHHMEPGAELAAERQLRDLGGDARVGRFDAHNHHMVSGTRVHVDTGNGYSLAAQQLVQLQPQRERTQQLTLIGRHPHIGDSHGGVIAVSDAIHPEGHPGHPR